MATVQMTLKLLIHKETNRVLYAEASKDFVDFLLCFLSLPLGSAVKLLNEKLIGSSIGNIYQSVKEMSDTHIGNKEILLNPEVSASSPNHPFLVKEKTEPRKTYYVCSTYSMNFISNKGPCSFCGCNKFKKNVTSNTMFECEPYYGGRNYRDCGRLDNHIGHLNLHMTDDPTTGCTTCSQPMSTKVTDLSYYYDPTSIGHRGYAKGLVLYLVTDDLLVMPMSTLSCMSLLQKFDIENVSLLEEKLVNFGLDQALQLLKASLQSKTALSDVFLGSN